jgi:parallel beta-helix repeat protein
MTIKDVIINNTDFMIMMYFCIDCRIENSTIFDNDGALCLLRSDYNLIKSNRLKNNFHGVLFDYQSKNNLIQSNEIKNNKNCGVILEYHSRNNFIFNNNFMQNKTLKFYNSYSIDSFLNIFDSNYWDDWVGFGPKIIFGRTTFFPTISLPIALDLRPKEKPYKFI